MARVTPSIHPHPDVCPVSLVTWRWRRNHPHPHPHPHPRPHPSPCLTFARRSVTTLPPPHPFRIRGSQFSDEKKKKKKKRFCFLAPFSHCPSRHFFKLPQGQIMVMQPVAVGTAVSDPPTDGQWSRAVCRHVSEVAGVPGGSVPFPLISCLPLSTPWASQVFNSSVAQQICST